VAPASTPATACVLQGTARVDKTTRCTFASTTNAVRGDTAAGAVTGVYGNTNPLETEPVAGTTGQTAAPDLVSISIDETANTVTYTFDENIETLGGTTGNRTGFRIYYQDGTSRAAQNADRTDSRTVVATFAGTDPVNSLTVGASVPTDTVCRQGETSTVTGRCNENDERGREVTFAAGDDYGPELVSFSTGSTTDIFGTTTGRFVDFLFDQTVTGSTNLTTGFWLFMADGSAEQLSFCTPAVRSTTATDATGMTVRCSVASSSTPTADQTADTNAISNAVIAGVSFDTVKNRTARTNGTGDQTYSNHEASAGPASA